MAESLGAAYVAGHRVWDSTPDKNDGGVIEEMWKMVNQMEGLWFVALLV